MSAPPPPPASGSLQNFDIDPATAKKLNAFFKKAGGVRQVCRYGAPGASGCRKGYAAKASKKNGRVCCHKSRAKAAAPKKRAPRKAAKKAAPRKRTRKAASRKRVAGHLYF